MSTIHLVLVIHLLLFSAALGMAFASKTLGLEDKQHVAIIGDGALTGGMAFEGLNHAGSF